MTQFWTNLTSRIAGTFSDNAYVALSALVLAQCGFVMVSSVIFSLPGTFVMGAAAAAGFALITTLGNFAGYTTPYLFGVLSDATGSFSAGFYGMGAISLESDMTTSAPRGASRLCARWTFGG